MVSPLTVRSTEIALKEESTEGTYVAESSGSDFINPREGSTLTPDVSSTDTDTYKSSIGMSAPIQTGENPTASLPQYFRGSGTEGQAPDYALLLKSGLGNQATESTEYDTVAGSTAGTSSAAAVINLDSGEGANKQVGEALLIKDETNGYSIRNIDSISTDALTCNFNLSNAPAAGVNTGKADLYYPADSGHPTFTLHRFQAGTSTGFHDAVSGARTTSVSATFEAGALPTVDFEIQALQYYLNPITISASNNKMDFNDGGGEESVTLTSKTYKTPKDLGDELASKMNAATSDTISVDYDSTDGKFTISSDGGTLSLLWNTGTNTANTCGAAFGFSVAADDTGATSYEADNTLAYTPAATAAPDSQDPSIVKNCELLLHNDFSRIDCREAESFSFTVDNTVTDVTDFCSETGIAAKLPSSRTTTFSATLIYEQHEVNELDAMLNNQDIKVMFNCGDKDSGGDWVPGTVVNVYLPQTRITAHPIAESDGKYVVNLEGTAYVGSSLEDIYVNLL